VIPHQEVAHEIERQNAIHPAGCPPTRDGIRLGLAAAQDELREALDAWRSGRCKCPDPMCGHHDWTDARIEIIQCAAVLLRIAAGIPVDGAP
jgi:hypothetical protein